MPAVAHVMPLTTTRAVRGPFDYRLGRHADLVAVGSLLRVPFAGRRLLGVVVGLADSSPIAPERLAEPDAVLGPGLTPELVELGLWMAREYCSTPARTLGLMLTPSVGAVEQHALVAEITPAGVRALVDGERLTAGQRAVLARLRADGALPAVELGTQAARRLERRGLVRLERRPIRRAPTVATVGSRSSAAPALTGPQRAALTRVREALQARRPERFLLHGVTGSGKTEVYLGAVEAALAAGRDAIVLVPEIALTPQALGRFQARFGDLVAVQHSGLAPGARRDEWLRVRNRVARVCVGPRSAVLAPVGNLGLIVVDEEHDSSYKHEGDPRYDARTVAARRAQACGAVLLCGSATPRPESVHALERLRLPERIDGRPLPAVEVLDMRGCHHPLHPETRLALGELWRRGGKAIVLLNRRGWSNFLSCRACGRVWMCPNCDVTLVLHGRPARPPAGRPEREPALGAERVSGVKGVVACHHCGHTAPAPSRCPECGSPALARHGVGTERLEHELSRALGGPSFPVFRLDADVGRARAGAVLEAFQAAGAGLLVGTQMVAKGHDFPDVRLAVVLDADQTLRFPDFRAEERTFALVTQLAGRAGRGGAGRVLVQTLAPQARSIRRAAAHDADGFLAEELEHRRTLGYPPYGSLIRVVCAAGEDGAARALAGRLRGEIEGEGRTVLGPAPLFRLRGKARAQLVIKALDRAAAIAAIGRAVERMSRLAARRRVSISVDVDPQ
jgi:primosomal protein N' (replication factor Y)